MNRVANIHLRGQRAARVYWPNSQGVALLVLFDGTDTQCQDICTRVRLVVLSVHPVNVHDAVAAVEWAASHAIELGARPERLIVAGTYAAEVAAHAQSEGWPALMERTET